ncbi:hypothetical protein [Saccharibacillus sacchari]|uniref:hypothetical protein n=1 Tax=Saccharibacillus sacchari TaxID=456493 RepID=UPI0004AFD37C|nr:hypothetical protein [Saccharibacillus sacchari]
MLKLNDPAWSRLTTAYGDGEEAVQLLRRLVTAAEDAELRQELFELLLHQDTIYTATLAAMPYLAAMAETTEHTETLVDLYIACGWMESGREHGADRLDIASSGEFRRERQPKLPDETIASIVEGYRIGLERLSHLYEQAAGFDLKGNKQSGDAASIASGEPEDNENPEAVYLLAAQAAYAGEIEVARLLLNFPEGDEYSGACPSCQADWYVWPKEGDAEVLVVYMDDPVTAQKENRDSAVVQAISATSLRAELQKLAHEAGRLGAHRLAVTIPSLDGQATCPECGSEVSVWAALVG